MSDARLAAPPPACRSSSPRPTPSLFLRRCLLIFRLYLRPSAFAPAPHSPPRGSSARGLWRVVVRLVEEEAGGFVDGVEAVAHRGSALEAPNARRCRGEARAVDVAVASSTMLATPGGGGRKALPLVRLRCRCRTLTRRRGRRHAGEETGCDAAWARPGATEHRPAAASSPAAAAAAGRLAAGAACAPPRCGGRACGLVALRRLRRKCRKCRRCPQTLPLNIISLLQTRHPCPSPHFFSQPRRLHLAARLFVRPPVQRLMLQAAVHHGATAGAPRKLFDRLLRL